MMAAMLVIEVVTELGEQTEQTRSRVRSKNE
jgi:hypothetical protein